MNNSAKKVCQPKKIGTHSGTFHCDEVLACFMLKQLPQYKDAEIVRTRDKVVLDECDIVVDVGGVYDPSKHRYDHHQRTFTSCMNTVRPNKPWATKLSSAGLVYCHFGEDVIAEILGIGKDDDKIGAIFDKVYENFMEEIDAIDNGISACKDPKYIISTGLSSRVKHLNPSWNGKDQNIEPRFQSAMEVTGSEFIDRIKYYNDCWWPAREIVEAALKNRFNVDPSGEVIEFTQGGCPWKEHLYALEETMKIETPIKYALYTDQNGKYRVQCVSISSTSFDNRLSLPEKWRGVRDEELSNLSGIPGCIFVHASGFIGGNETRDGALTMARKSLELARQ
ncbi:MYG1 exonuclease-like isoform X2 [Antedon mediterranea]